jgi:predicted metal-binding membrane protein
MFALGVGSFAWMLVLGALMAIEKNLPLGRRLVRPTGVILFLSALLVVNGW